MERDGDRDGNVGLDIEKDIDRDLDITMVPAPIFRHPLLGSAPKQWTLLLAARGLRPPSDMGVSKNQGP